MVENRTFFQQERQEGRREAEGEGGQDGRDPRPGLWSLVPVTTVPLLKRGAGFQREFYTLVGG